MEPLVQKAYEQAAPALPPAVIADDHGRPAKIDIGQAELVCITFQRQNAWRNKTSHWFWSVQRADRAQGCAMAESVSELDVGLPRGD